MEKQENKKYIVFVSWGRGESPLVVSSTLSLDSEYNIYFDMSNNLKEATIFDNVNAFKQIKKSLEYNKDYEVSKFYLKGG